LCHIDTTYHFKETLEYKEKLTKLFGLKVIDIQPDKEQNEFSKIGELWRYDPDQCCHINKVEPFEKIRNEYEIWISGLMYWQSNHREKLNIFEEKKGVIKFYPILDVSEEEALKVIEDNNLPIHPLKPLGYESIGCKHCTLKGKKRKCRWAQTANSLGLGTSICGDAPTLYPDLIDALVEWGIESISVSLDAVAPTHLAIARAEQRLILAASRRWE